MGFAADDDVVARPRQHAQRDLVGHRSRRQPERRSPCPAARRRAPAARWWRVLAVLVVADGRGGHRGAHRRGRPRHGVGAQVDRLGSSCGDCRTSGRAAVRRGGTPTDNRRHGSRGCRVRDARPGRILGGAHVRPRRAPDPRSPRVDRPRARVRTPKSWKRGARRAHGCRSGRKRTRAATSSSGTPEGSPAVVVGDRSPVAVTSRRRPRRAAAKRCEEDRTSGSAPAPRDRADDAEAGQHERVGFRFRHRRHRARRAEEDVVDREVVARGGGVAIDQAQRRPRC